MTSGRVTVDDRIADRDEDDVPVFVSLAGNEDLVADAVARYPRARGLRADATIRVRCGPRYWILSSAVNRSTDEDRCRGRRAPYPEGHGETFDAHRPKRIIARPAR